MNSAQREKTEQELKARCAAGDFKRATELALTAYGPEILSFLWSFLRDEQEAGEVFSEFSESLWKGIGGFEWKSSLRTWAYVLARHAALKHREKANVRRAIPLSEAPEVADLAAQVRTTTINYLRTETKSRVAQLRESLDPEDRMLLTLRIDRELDWKEIAEVTLADGKPGRSLEKEAARLRQRFQTVKEKLKERARKEGLLRNDG